MRHDFTFPSADGKTTIHAIKWVSSKIDNGKEPKAILQLTHGMVEYIERYEAYADFMAEQGYVVVGHDHLGHGDSVTSKEEWGYFGKNPLRLLLADMDQLRQLTRKEYPDLPYFMLGHSMGSYLLRSYLVQYGEGLSGAIIMGTGFVPKALAKFGQRLATAMGAVRGMHHKSKLIEGMAFGKSYARYDMTGKDLANSWLTKQGEVVEKYYHEPRCLFGFTLNGYLGLFQAVETSCDPAKASKINRSLPLLIVSGEDDPVGDLGEGVLKTYQMYRNLGFADLTCKLYEDDRHEILNETDRDVVYADLLAWMEARRLR